MTRRFVIIGLAALAAVLLVLLLTLGVLTGTSAGRSALAGFVSERLSTPQRKITIGGLTGIWSGNLTVGHVVVADGGTPWLVARDIRVVWSPWALLSGTFRADLVHAGSIEVARPTATETGADSGGSSGLPVRLDIAEIDLPEILLDDSLAGGIARLAATGRLVADNAPMRVEADAGLRRTDGTEGTLQANVVYRPDDDRLDVEMSASEPGDGILVNLLGIEGRPRVDLSVTGSGPAADWSGKATLAFDGEQAAEVSATHRLGADGRRVTAEGSGAFDRILPERYAGLAAGGADFRFAVLQMPDGGLTVEEAALQSSALTAQARGTIDLDGPSHLEVSARGVHEPVRLELGTEQSPLTVELMRLVATVAGEGPDMSVTAEVAAERVALAQGTLSGVVARLASDGFDAQARRGPFSLTASASRFESPIAELDRLAGGAVSLQASGRMDGDTVTVAKSSLSAGHVSADITGSAAADGATFDLAASLAAAGAGFDGSLAALVGEQLNGSVRLRGDDGAFRAEDIEIGGGNIAVSGSAGLDAEGSVDAALSGRIPELGRVNPQLAGGATFEASLEGPAAAPRFRVEAGSDAVEAAGQAVSGLALSAEGIANAAAPSADVTVSGTIEGRKIDGTAHLATRGEQRVLEGLRVAVGDNTISGDLELDPSFRPAGVLAIDLPDLEPIGALALQTISGDLKGRAEFLLVADTPILSLQATGGRIGFGDTAAEDISIDATVEDYLAAPRASGTVGARSITAGGARIDRLRADLTAGGAWTEFLGEATVNGNPAHLKGAFGFADGALGLRLASGRTSYQGIDVALAEPSGLSVRDGTARIEKLVLSVGAGTVTVTGTAGQTLAIQARLSGVSASLVDKFVPGLGAAGAVSGRVDVTGNPADPAIAYDVTWSGASVAQSAAAGVGGLTLRSDGRFVSGGLTFKADLSSSDGLTLSGGGSLQTAGARTLDLSFKGAAPMRLVAAKLAAQGISLDGTARVDLSIRGPASAPQVVGAFTTSGARFLDARTGIAIRNINADIGFTRTVATIRTLTGDLAAGGSISARGSIGLDPAEGLPADVTATMRDASYTDGELVTADLSGDVTLKGPLTQGGVLGGTINVARATITVPERLPGTLSRLNVQHRNAPERVRRQADALEPETGGSGASTTLGLDLTLSAPGQIFIRGRGLDAELGGTLKLAGTTSAPQASGTFNLVRGRLSILARRLEFESGSIGFGGSLVPVVDFVAQTVTNDATVSVAVTGSANDPKFAFESSPALPEDEVLAQLIFGRSIKNLSPLQIAQLAEAAAQLAGVGGSTGLLDRLRGQIGVDDLDVKTTESGDTAVSVGKYLNDRTYLNIEKGSKAGSGKATIDLKIGRGLKLRGQASEDGETKGGIFFEKDY